MRGMPFDSQHKGVLQDFHQQGSFSFFTGKGVAKPEQEYVLDSRRSSSPSSTLSSSLGGSGASSDTAGVAAVSDSHPRWPASTDWASELQPISSGGDKCGMAVEDWEAMLSVPPPASPTQEQTFLQWIMDDPERTAPHFTTTGFGDPGFVIDPVGAMGGTMTSTSQFAPMTTTNFPPLYDDKQFVFGHGHGLVLNHHQHQHQQPPNPAFFLPAQPFSVVEPTCQIPPQAYQNPAPPYHLQQRQMKPKAAPPEDAAAQQQQALVDQLLKAAELIEAGNPVSARGILARLNHQLPSPVGKPLHRSVYYFKEALHQITTNPSASYHRPPATPLDVVLKLSTYKAFSEVSPVLQFTNFTCIQALLEELGGSDRIHIIDFDIAVGGQWSAFMQELAQHRSSGAGAPFLKITAFASPASQHPLELYLTRENLTHFARDLNIPFEFNVLSLDPFDPSLLLTMCAGADEAIAVNLPVGCHYHPPVPTLLRLVKQLSPKIVVSVDHGCDRSDLSFSHQFFHAFQSCTVLLDSIDAAGTNLDVSNKIERFLLQPRIENALLSRQYAGEKTLPWRNLFAAAGFAPMQFSNFAETQAECLLKRVQVRGFHVEKRHSSLFLCWQRGELVSVSAWRC